MGLSLNANIRFCAWYDYYICISCQSVWVPFRGTLTKARVEQIYAYKCKLNKCKLCPGKPSFGGSSLLRDQSLSNQLL